MMNNYQCRVCGSKNTENLGVLPKQTHFAGRQLDKNLAESSLYKCNNCLMLARHPILSISDYNSLYAQLCSTVWSKSNMQLRPDQIAIKNIILNKNKDVCKVLDVGCYTGDLLASLPNRYLKYGVEMSKEASQVSVGKGVSIIGNDLYNIKTSEKFDLIIAMDVIEHTNNPEEFLKKLAAMLEVDGELIISTGNSDNWLWKVLKNRFWYSKFSEHISFIGVRWLEQFCKNNNFITTDKYFFSYMPMSFQSFVKNTAKFVLTLMRINPERFSNTTKDHFCFILKKKIFL